MQMDYATTAGLVTPVLPRFQSPTWPIRPVVSIDPHTAIAWHQHISNAISTAQWHLAHGRIEQASSRIQAVAQTLEQTATNRRTA